jgi:hypothetical protein
MLRIAGALNAAKLVATTHRLADAPLAENMAKDCASRRARLSCGLVPKGGFRVLCRVAASAALSMLTYAALSAPNQALQPAKSGSTEAKIISAASAQPTEVKIISVPAATPAEVKILSSPPETSAHNLVTATWVLVFANAVLCLATFGGARKQSRDLKNRELAAMRREVNRAAHRVIVTATRLDQLAVHVPSVRGDLHALWGGMSAAIEGEVTAEMESRRARFKEIVDGARAIVDDDFTDMPEKKLTQYLFRLDEHEEQLEGMRDSITRELEGYESDRLILQNLGTSMAVATSARLNRLKPKTS